MLVVPEYLQRNGPRSPRWDTTRRARALLAKARERIRPTGKLSFSAFTDEELDGFEDRDAHTLLRAHYGRSFMETLLANTGWSVDGFYPRDRARYIAANVWLFRRPI
jgi:hypothetical protein